MKSGFTLAEVLITLTIIGVIAALTIPSLLQNIQNAQYRTAWRRADSIISQAVSKLTTDNGGSLNGVFINHDDVRNKLAAYFSYTQKCDAYTALGSDGCWNANIYDLSGNNYTDWTMSPFSRIILSNGMLAAFYLDSANCTYSRAARQNGCAKIAVDVNGFKGPNTVGKDIYFGTVTGDGSFEPFGKTGDFWTLTTSRGCDLTANPAAIGYACAAQYLYQ